MPSKDEVYHYLLSIRNALALGEPDDDMVETWHKALIAADRNALRALGQEQVRHLERMPTLPQVLKALGRAAHYEPEACPDCQHGIRAGYYRLTCNRYDEGGRVIGEEVKRAEVALACTCAAGERYRVSTSTYDEWQREREAQRRADTDIVWVADRTQRNLPRDIFDAQVRAQPASRAGTFAPPSTNPRQSARKRETPRVREWQDYDSVEDNDGRWT